MPDNLLSPCLALLGDTHTCSGWGDKGEQKTVGTGGPGRTSAGRRSKGRSGRMPRHEASPALKSFDGRGGNRTAVDRTAKKRQQGVTYGLHDTQKNHLTNPPLLLCLIPQAKCFLKPKFQQKISGKIRKGNFSFSTSISFSESTFPTLAPPRFNPTGPGSLRGGQAGPHS